MLIFSSGIQSNIGQIVSLVNVLLDLASELRLLY